MPSSKFPARRALGISRPGRFSVQLGLSVALLVATLQRALLVMIPILYGSGPARAWEVTGIRRAN
jgi:hypothetical protein